MAGRGFSAAVCLRSASVLRKPIFMNGSKSELKELLNKVRSGFRFEYVGGGYFRDKTVPKGISAEILHGGEILDEFCSELMRQYSAKTR